MVQPINSFTEFQSVINSGRPCAIDFWATWCAPCRAISPIFEKFSGMAEFSMIDFYKVDVDAQEKISQEVGIRAMPTFIVFKNGQKVGDLVGANPKGLENLLKSAQALG
ncbi:thioredoxin [Ktedonosporobacter rubrisoli]|uniref:Thioredoxin n=1 Tax=Ktedonosporobacter rubrisoli TaxID=2509675 RepID=A0A4P6JUI6_KTERU|nr:thioredoxin [Ktedonosporobacter rubrisoli]QBD78970.1 thioredoxin [Ktedonosporobacter rubrisoli]